MIRSASYATNSSLGGRSASGMTNLGINITPDKNRAQEAFTADHNQISSEAYASRNYDGDSLARTGAMGVVHSGAWDGSVNEANPRTKMAAESVYSTIQGSTSASAQTRLGGDEVGSDFTNPNADQPGKKTLSQIRSLVLHDSAYSSSDGVPPYSSADPQTDRSDPKDNGFMTNAYSQRMTPGRDIYFRAASNAEILSGNLIVMARMSCQTRLWQGGWR